MIPCILILPHWGLTSVTNWTGISQLRLMCIVFRTQISQKDPPPLASVRKSRTNPEAAAEQSLGPSSILFRRASFLTLLHVPSATWGTSEDHGGVVGQSSECFPRKMGRKLGKLYPPPSFRWLRLPRPPLGGLFVFSYFFSLAPWPHFESNQGRCEKRSHNFFFFILDFQTCLSF